MLYEITTCPYATSKAVRDSKADDMLANANLVNAELTAKQADEAMQELVRLYGKDVLNIIVKMPII